MYDLTNLHRRQKPLMRPQGLFPSCDVHRPTLYNVIYAKPIVSYDNYDKPMIIWYFTYTLHQLLRFVFEFIFIFIFTLYA